MKTKQYLHLHVLSWPERPFPCGVGQGKCPGGLSLHSCWLTPLHAREAGSLLLLQVCAPSLPGLLNNCQRVMAGRMVTMGQAGVSRRRTCSIQGGWRLCQEVSMHVALFLLRGSGSASGTAVTSSPVQGQEQTNDLFVCDLVF